jgi:hypothetical protein
LANLNKLIVLNLIEVPNALNRISDPERRKEVLGALRSEIRAALEEGRTTLDKMQTQLDEATENHQMATDAVQKQELELIKLRQKDAPSSELATASSLLDPLKEAMHRFGKQKEELQAKVYPLRGTVEALSDKLMVLGGYNIDFAPKPDHAKAEHPKTTESRSEAKPAEPKASKETKETPKTRPEEKQTETKAAPKNPVYPAGSYNPFKMVDYIVGKIEAEELLAGIDEKELKAYLAQKELEKLEEEADISKRLNELKKRLSNG